MFYGITTKATDWPEGFDDAWYIKLIYIVFFFLRANPDIEKLYPKVKKWMIECNEDGWPKREIAFDNEDNILFCTPNQRNTGYWTDMSAIQFKQEELELIEKSQFEKYWDDNF